MVEWVGCNLAWKRFEHADTVRPCAGILLLDPSRTFLGGLVQMISLRVRRERSDGLREGRGSSERDATGAMRRKVGNERRRSGIRRRDSINIRSDGLRDRSEGIVVSGSRTATDEVVLILLLFRDCLFMVGILPSSPSRKSAGTSLGEEARVGAAASHHADTMPKPHLGADSSPSILTGDSRGVFSSDITRCTKGLLIWLSTLRNVRG